MRIRSITYFCNPGYPLDEAVLRQAAEFLAQAKAAYEASGYEVQSTRLATVPFPRLLGADRLDQLPRLSENLAALLPQVGIAYASLGPALPGLPRSYGPIPEAIAAGENIFFGGVMADRQAGIDLPRSAPARRSLWTARLWTRMGSGTCALPRLPTCRRERPSSPPHIMRERSRLLPSRPRLPTSPSAPLKARCTVEEGRRALIEALEHHGHQMEEIASTRLWHTHFGGIDFSLAPFPDDSVSLGGAVERMGVPSIGLHGSLAAAAILTDAIQEADFPHTGFCGLMQPILEDSVLTRRAAEGTLTIKDALLYSAVCGTGLDTVPLPGDTTAEQTHPPAARSLRAGSAAG